MGDIISLGEWIKRWRKALDLPQNELAQRVCCSLATIQKIEEDARRPSREIAARLADTLALVADERTAFIQAARAPTRSVARRVCADAGHVKRRYCWTTPYHAINQSAYTAAGADWARA